MAQQSRYTPQLCGVVIDDEDTISIVAKMISLALSANATLPYELKHSNQSNCSTQTRFDTPPLIVGLRQGFLLSIDTKTG